jgi:DNA-binding NarL/FixJ family response regulator
MSEYGDIKVLVVDDHAVFRKSLQTFLRSRTGIQVVGEAENGLDALDKIKESGPDVVLMDVQMPVLGGIDATRQIKKMFPGVIVIALSSHTDDFYVQKMMDAGSIDYLAKDAKPREIELSILNAVSQRDYPSRAKGGQCPETWQ